MLVLYMCCHLADNDVLNFRTSSLVDYLAADKKGWRRFTGSNNVGVNFKCQVGKQQAARMQVYVWTAAAIFNFKSQGYT